MKNPVNQHLTAEQSFILNCLKFLCASDSPGWLQNERLDWDRILSVANRHRIGAFLAYALKQAGFQQVPGPIQGSLKSSVETAVVENLAKRIEFKKYSGLFADQGISVIPLKGIALTHAVYEALPVRRMGDIDIFVKENDLAKIKTLLVEQGFCEKAFANLWHTGIVSRLIGRGSYVKKGLDMDLQWRPRFYIGENYVEWDSGEAWREAVPCPALGKTVYLFSPRHQAQYLLLQIANDFDQDYLFFVQLLDLAMVMKKSELKLAGILEGWGGKLRPESKRRIEKLSQVIQELFFSPRESQDLSPEAAETIRRVFESKLDARAAWGGRGILPAPIPWREKLIFFAGYLFPEPEYIRQQYGPGVLAWLRGFGGHWARLVFKALKFFPSRLR